MKRSVLLAAALVASLLAGVPGAGAQTEESSGEFTTLSVDSDQVTDRVGLVDPVTGIWHIRGAGGAVNSFFYGNPGDFPIAGDWDCDGISTPGLYRQSDGFVYLRNSNSQGVADIRFFFGNPGDIPLAGDFNGDGCDTVSIYRAPESRIYVINELGANDGGLGAADFNYVFGNPGDKPFVGDFDGDGIDTVGLHRESTGFVYFRQSHTQGIANAEFFFGDPGDRLVAGDWGVVDDVDTPAIFRPSLGRFFFRYTNTQGNANEEIQMGSFQMLPVAGSWTVKMGLAGTLPKAVVGIPYSSSALKLVGGTPPYTVTKTTGPAWVTVNNAGRFSGTPPQVGTFNVGITVTDSKGLSSNQLVPLTVQDGCDTNAQISDAKCLALVQLYRATNGNGWVNRTGWFTSPPCQWFGVTCVGANVTELKYDSNGLTGTIPTTGWSSLTGLQVLNLEHNALTGTIPAALANLVNAQLLSLDLSDNLLTGAIPAFTGLTGIQELDLSTNNFTGGVPAGLNGRTALRILDLAENPLGGALPNLGSLVNLQTLQLSETGLDMGIPNMFTNMGALVEVDLSQNALTGLVPSSLGGGAKPGITDLDLAQNQLAGEIPSNLQNLTTLTVPGGLSLCSNGVLLINGLATDQPADPLWQFVNARDDFWNAACP